MRHFLIIVVILTQTLLFAQISDDFSDGDFTANPTWTGTTADYIVNGSFELQLNSTAPATSYLSTPHGLSTMDNKEWNLYVKQAFSPSSSNYGRIYLTANSTDLSTNPDGFYIQLGEAGSGDAVRLVKRDAGVSTDIIVGTAGQIASSFSIRIRVLRDNTGTWSLYVDPTGGTNYVLEGTATDATNLLGSYFGLLQTYTISNATDFYYDDIYVGDEVVDTVPPSLISATAINANAIDVLFDEPLDQLTAEDIMNYDIQPVVSISSAILDGANPALVHLVTGSALTNGNVYTLFTDNIADLNGNASGSQNVDFTYFVPETPSPGDVIINEFVCDPTPTVGLPEVEFVEIYNKSSKYFDVGNWQLGDASSNGTITSSILAPDQYMILTSLSGVDSFAVATAVTSFPSLNNTGDAIVLRDDNGVLLDSISYTDEWYHDDNKSGGGYSIERINPNDPCSDETNWSASNSSNGGTPGFVNSIFDNTPDTDPPYIDHLVALAPNFLEIYYSERMDSTSLKDASIFVNPTLTVQNNYVLEANPSSQVLEFVENFVGSQQYTIELQNLGDCWLNTTNVNGVFALPETPAVGDVVINEILFDPVSGGSDWVEVYNTSDKLLDMNGWQFANYDNDTIDNIKQNTEHYLLYPGEYVVFGEDTTQIMQYYKSAVSGKMIEMDLPTYSNDSSTVFLLYNNTLMDRVAYSDDWHFSLLDETDGVSLERIDAFGNSNDKNNWHSAAETVGFATPGKVNSQYFPAIINGEFSYTSNTISPDNDGFEDVLQVNYQMVSPGLVGTFTIYDERGRRIAQVMKSELLSTEGTFVWDGVKEDNTKATIGTYVGVFEAFDVNGGVVFAQKKAFVVAGKL